MRHVSPEESDKPFIKFGNCEASGFRKRSRDSADPGSNFQNIIRRTDACRCIGVDNDPAKISRARAGYGHLPGLRFVLADARRYLSAAVPGSADLVLSIFGAFSFTDPQPLLTGAARILRPGGRLAMTLRADDHHDTVVVLSRR